jgi:uncharacterized protein YjlB
MEPKAQTVAPAGEFPNSPALPVLIYRRALPALEASAAAFESRFTKNGWAGVWRNGLYAFHHYHSRGHEVLGVAKGWVSVQLGGEDGQVLRLEAGDAVTLPAGVAHKRAACSADYCVVGAYPPGQWPDMNTGKPGEREAALVAIAALAIPESDPVLGRGGPLPDLYARALRKGATP